MGRSVVVFHSFTGNNALLARRLAHKLGARAVPVREMRRGRRSFFTVVMDLMLNRLPAIHPIELAADEQTVLFVAPVYDELAAHPIRRAVATLGASAPGGYAFATLCGYHREQQSEKIRAQLTALAGRPPKRVWELHVCDLFPETLRENAITVSGHVVTEAELDRFAPQIEAIVADLHAPAPA